MELLLLQTIQNIAIHFFVAWFVVCLSVTFVPPAQVIRQI